MERNNVRVITTLAIGGIAIICLVLGALIGFSIGDGWTGMLFAALAAAAFIYLLVLFIAYSLLSIVLVIIRDTNLD